MVVGASLFESVVRWEWTEPRAFSPVTRCVRGEREKGRTWLRVGYCLLFSPLPKLRFAPRAPWVIGAKVAPPSCDSSSVAPTHCCTAPVALQPEAQSHACRLISLLVPLDSRELGC